MGLIAGTNVARLARGEEPIELPQATMIGALANYITVKEGTLQPINSNWGLVPTVPKKENGRRLSKPDRRERQARMALEELDGYLGKQVKVAG
jgi:methylenetetrahydrofolate--tRNA-(uracil-5-)-methyltransferase